ncbi:MAG: hypothetical protein ABI615_10520, partial [Chthoniobacterales bacterium]
GTLQSENDITGKGRLEMIQGKIEPPTFIQQLGVLLRIKELQMLVFQQSFVNFSINDQKFHVDDMKLESERIFFSAKGYIRFNKKVNLDARFGVSEEIQKELHGLADNFQSSTDRPGYKELIFAVSGKTDKLNSNLPEKIGIPKGLLQIGNNLGGFLKGFIAPSAPPQATPSATPQASPN